MSSGGRSKTTRDPLRSTKIRIAAAQLAASAPDAKLRAVLRFESLDRLEEDRSPAVPIEQDKCRVSGPRIQPSHRETGDRPKFRGGRSSALWRKQIRSGFIEVSIPRSAAFGLAALPAWALQRVFEQLPTAGHLGCRLVGRKWREATSDLPISTYSPSNCIFS